MYGYISFTVTFILGNMFLFRDIYNSCFFPVYVYSPDAKKMRVCLFIYSVVHSAILSFIYFPFVRSFVCALIITVIRLFSLISIYHWFVYLMFSFIHQIIHFCVYSNVNAFSHFFLPSFLRYFIQSIGHITFLKPA